MFQPGAWEVQPVTIFDPEYDCGVQMPCPVHGFQSAADGSEKTVVRQGLNASCRPILQVSGCCRFVASVEYTCKQCRAEIAALKAIAAASPDNEDLAKRVQERSWHFHSYDPRVQQKYIEAGRSDVLYGLNAVININGTIFDKAFARFLRILNGKGVNCHILATAAEEVAAATFDEQYLLPFLHSQKKHRDAGTIERLVTTTVTSGATNTICTATPVMTDYYTPTNGTTAAQMVPPIVLKATATGFHTASDATMSSLVQDMQRAEEDYQFVHREDTVGGCVLQMDHTDKFLLAKSTCSHVYTCMNERGEVLLRLFCATTSYYDDVLRRGFAHLFGEGGIFSDGRLLPSLAYFDCPQRDAVGATKGIPSLRREPIGGAFSFGGEIVEVRSEVSEEYTSALAYLQQFEILGFDTENRACLEKGGTNGPPAMLQLCGDQHKCFIFRLNLFPCCRLAACSVADSTAARLPQGLVELLVKKQLVGVGVKGDITRLKKAYVNCATRTLDNVGECQAEARAVLKIKMTRQGVSDFVLLLFRQSMDKALGGDGRPGPNGMLRVGGLADWEVVDLSSDSLQYAANDAFAHWRVWQAIHDPSLRHDRFESNYPEGDDASDHGRLQLDYGSAQAAAATALGVPSPAVMSHLDLDKVHLDARSILTEEELQQMEDAALADGQPIDADDDGIVEVQSEDIIVKAAKACVDCYLRQPSRLKAQLPIPIPDQFARQIHEYAQSQGLESFHENDPEGGGKIVFVKAKSETPMPTQPVWAPVFDANWKELKTLYDHRHWMANWFLMARSKELKLYRYFCSCTMDAIFKLLPESKKAVDEHLKKRGVSEDKRKRLRRKYWRNRCRYFIPEPQRLIRDLTMVYTFFKVLDDANGSSFFRSNHDAIFHRMIQYAAHGYLSA